MHTFSPMQKLLKLLSHPTDVTQLVYFRLAFGGLMLWEVIRYFAYGRIYKYFIEPKYNFHFYNLDFIKPLPGNGMYVVFAVMGICALLVTIGLFYRVASVGLFVSFTYMFLLDQTRYLNHFYLLSLICLLMIFIPANGDFSLDYLRKPQLRQRKSYAWHKYTLMFQLSVAYFFGGIAKLNSDWLQGEPIRMWLARRLDFPIIGQYFTEEWMVYFFAYGGLLFDLLIVPLLLWKKTRWPAFIAAAFFHLMNDQLFLIGIFPWFMLFGTAILFFDLLPPFWRNWKSFKDAPALQSIGISASKLSTYFIILYAVIQVLLPFRHWLFPGNVSWTEEGHKFSWHMKLRSKIAHTRFFIEDKFNKKRQEISPSFFLNDNQVRKMAGHPEMIIQFSHFLEKKLAEDGIRNIEIKTLSYASLNGRKMQLLVDSTIDLAAQENTTFKHYNWVLPLETPLKGD